MFDWILNMPLYFVNATIAVKNHFEEKGMIAIYCYVY